MKHIKVNAWWDKIGTDFTGSAIDYFGHIAYFVNGKRHREGGPAIECANGDKFWWLHDKQHREDGPACEYASSYKSWYYNDELISYDPNYRLENFQREIKLRIFK